MKIMSLIKEAALDGAITLIEIISGAAGRKAGKISMKKLKEILRKEYRNEKNTK